MRIPEFKVKEIHRQKKQKLLSDAKKDIGDPGCDQLVIAGKDGKHPAHGDMLFLLALPLRHTEKRQCLKQDKTKPHDQGDHTKSLYGIARDHDRHHAGNGKLTDAYKDPHGGHDAVPLLRVARKARQHPPIGDIIDRIGHTPEQIDHAEKSHEPPAGLPYGKHEDQHQRIHQRSCQDKRPEFAALKMTIFDDGAHKKVVDRIPDHADHHGHGDHGKLRHRKIDRVLHIGQKKHANKNVGRVSARRTHAIRPFCLF